MPQIHPLQGEWTVDDIWLLPGEGERFEVIDGELLVTPSPRYEHQAAIAALYDRLKPFVAEQRLGVLVFAPADVVLGPRTVVEPDLFLAPFFGGRRPRHWSEVTRLILVIEVLSWSTAGADRGRKRGLYQSVADEYWLVDLEERRLERWRPGDERPEIFDGTLTWQPAGADAPLTVDLPAFFREVWEE